jgi:hypothetical protein
LTIGFTDLSIGNPTSWQWIFGDGTGSTEQNPTHEYLNPDSGTAKKFSVCFNCWKWDKMNANFQNNHCDQ